MWADVHQGWGYVYNDPVNLIDPLGLAAIQFEIFYTEGSVSKPLITLRARQTFSSIVIASFNKAKANQNDTLTIMWTKYSYAEYKKDNRPTIGNLGGGKFAFFAHEYHGRGAAQGSNFSGGISRWRIDLANDAALGMKVPFDQDVLVANMLVHELILEGFVGHTIDKELSGYPLLLEQNNFTPELWGTPGRLLFKTSCALVKKLGIKAIEDKTIIPTE
jgi:hypothetical protein